MQTSAHHYKAPIHLQLRSPKAAPPSATQPHLETTITMRLRTCNDIPQKQCPAIETCNCMSQKHSAASNNPAPPGTHHYNAFNHLQWHSPKAPHNHANLQWYSPETPRNHGSPQRHSPITPRDHGNLQRHSPITPRRFQRPSTNWKPPWQCVWPPAMTFSKNTAQPCKPAMTFPNNHRNLQWQLQRIKGFSMGLVWFVQWLSTGLSMMDLVFLQRFFSPSWHGFMRSRAFRSLNTRVVRNWIILEWKLSNNALHHNNCAIHHCNLCLPYSQQRCLCKRTAFSPPKSTLRVKRLCNTKPLGSFIWQRGSIASNTPITTEFGMQSNT